MSETLARVASAIGGRIHGVDPSVASAIRISDVTHDSRTAGPGVAFVAIRGFTTDGHDHVVGAVSGGAAAVIVEEPPPVGVPAVVVPDTRSALGTAAAFVHRNPSASMQVLGVTGTNGKTTVTRLVESILTDVGRRVGVIGTLGTRIAGVPRPGERTTPEADDVQRLLAEMVRRHVATVAMEVSSHALELGRVIGTRFAVAGFTNLSQDHLDFHGDMDRYRAAKERLFLPDLSDEAVVWVDDPVGREIADSVSIPVTTVGERAPADISISTERVSIAGSTFRLRGLSGREITVEFPLPGGFMVANAAVAAAMCLRAGAAPDEIRVGLEHAQPVPGRFERVDVDGPAEVVVDYSHTPAGITAAIETARALTSGRVIGVIGAGGDRDRSKRSLMGAAASGADQVVVTSDNPRSEDPTAIMADVMEGVQGEAAEIVDRREAIRAALAMARAGDIVLVMGKGHEAYQEVAGRRIPFDDRVVAREEASRP